MRIIVVSPPRSGNHWTKCLLAHIYRLKQIGGEESQQINPRGLRDANADVDFPDGSIAHMHSRYTPKLASRLETLPAHLVTPVRDPYDVFLSYYRWVQTRTPKREAGVAKAERRPRSKMVGKPLDHPDVLSYLAEDFSLQRAYDWFHSGRAIPVRYEDLHADPMATLKRVTDQIEVVDQAAIEAAVAACQIEAVLKANPRLSHTVRTGKVGESRSQLTEEHLQIIRERWGDHIASLGYQVR